MPLVCSMCVGLLAYLKNNMAEIHQLLCTLHMAVAWCSSSSTVTNLCTSRFVDNVMFSYNGHIARHVYS